MSEKIALGDGRLDPAPLLRACRGLDIVGADIVEVAPDLDPTHLTGTLAAAIASGDAGAGRSPRATTW